LLAFQAFDFIDEPIFIAGGVGEYTDEETESEELSQTALREFFMQNRSTIFAKNGIIISSQADQNRSLITQNGPSNAVVKKLQMLALASRKKVSF